MNNARLNEIVKALGELNRCVEQRKDCSTVEEKVGVFLGEMDWQRELHRLLHGDE